MPTLTEDVAEDGLRVDEAAVPPAVLELPLALLDGALGARLHRAHYVHVPPADLLLPARQSRQLAAVRVRLQQPHVTRGGQRSV